MIRINLLPHRAAFRQQQIVEHIVAVASVALVAIVLVVAVDIYATSDLTALQEERANLVAQNKVLSKKIGELRNLDTLRKDVEGKLAIVDELQSGRFRSLITFASIAQSIPQNIWVSSILNTKGSVKIDGFGDSSQAVASFMRALEGQDAFSGVQLVVDAESRVEEVLVRKFSLTLHRLTLAELEANKEGADNGSK